MIIYKITNKENNKSYIGQTLHSLDTRWKQHLRNSNYKKYQDIYFYRALRTYHVDVWELEILETLEFEDKLSEREVHWISFYHTFGNGYNSTSGGERGKISPETKLKMSESHKGKSHPTKGRVSPFKGMKHTSETILKLIKPKSEEHKRKLSESMKNKTPWNLGISHSEETKNKISATQKLRKRKENL